jgi:8-oxo-dGTP diphosphatase
MTGSSRPSDPRGLSAAFRQGRVLVVRRARAPLIGHFSLPGGVVEVGETLAAAVARELTEEVGIEAEIIAFNRHVEAIVHEGTEYGRILSSLRLSPAG